MSPATLWRKLISFHSPLLKTMGKDWYIKLLMLDLLFTMTNQYSFHITAELVPVCDHSKTEYEGISQESRQEYKSALL